MGSRDEDQREENFLQVSVPPFIPLRIMSFISSASKDNSLLLQWLSEVLKNVADADGYSLYVKDSRENGRTLSLLRQSEGIMKNKNARNRNLPIKTGDTISGYVAATEETIVADTHLNRYRNSRYPNGLGSGSTLELYRGSDKQQFSETETEICSLIANLFTACSHHCKQNSGFQQLLNITETLLAPGKNSMSDIVPQILKQLCCSLVADKATLFILNESHNELIAEYFSDDDDRNIKDKLRCNLDKGIVGYVARMRNYKLVSDCYSESVFNQEVDKKTGYKTRNMIAGPIVRGNKLIGVVEVLNKKGNLSFTPIDMETLKMFGQFLELLFGFYQMSPYLEDHSFHIARHLSSSYVPCEESLVIRMFNDFTNFKLPPDINNYEFPYTTVQREKIPHFVSAMFIDLLEESSFPKSKLFRFVLTVFRNYRNVHYHNILHAFSVTQGMYCILKDYEDYFTVHEKQALMIASFCHDSDHPGLTNGHLKNTNHMWSKLYTSAYLENHHYDVTISILQDKRIDILSHFPSDTTNMIFQDIQHTILATDLQSYNNNMQALKNWVAEEVPDTHPSYKLALKAVMMASCDVIAAAKPFDVYLEAVYSLYEEFHAQGDKEKSMGMKPIAMFDRDQFYTLPKQQMDFIEFIVFPMFELLLTCLPKTEVIQQTCRKHYEYWEVVDMWQNNPFASVDDEPDWDPFNDY